MYKNKCWHKRKRDGGDFIDQTMELFMYIYLYFNKYFKYCNMFILISFKCIYFIF